MLNRQGFCKSHVLGSSPGFRPIRLPSFAATLRRDVERVGFVFANIQPLDWLHPASPKSFTIPAPANPAAYSIDAILPMESGLALRPF